MANREDKVEQYSQVTYREIYQLFDNFRNEVSSSRKELNDSIHGLEEKFDRLVDGRFSMLEKQVANMQGRNAAFAAAISAGISLLGLLLSIFLRLQK